MTDDTGAYKLTTFVNGDGALPGSYKVTITKFPGAAATAGTGTSGPAKPEDIDAIYKQMQQAGKYGPDAQKKGAGETKNELASKFADANTSGLTAEVKSGGATNFDFEVN